MRTVSYIMTVLAVIALAFWSYQENYETRKVLNDADNARRDIREAHARLGVLRAEWACLIWWNSKRISIVWACSRLSLNNLEILIKFPIPLNHCCRS